MTLMCQLIILLVHVDILLQSKCQGLINFIYFLATVGIYYGFVLHTFIKLNCQHMHLAYHMLKFVHYLTIFYMLHAQKEKIYRVLNEEAKTLEYYYYKKFSLLEFQLIPHFLHQLKLFRGFDCQQLIRT